ncbi:serine/threonine protein kinase [Rhodoferax sp.]|uniref:serine/threonine protein kinase n=1 Tax=Rhodoferax sp. TaxID=50421 RepID=UPI002757B51B|nr:serine/threonine-protein kinase [Rhodoferax sp.]
MIDLPIRVAAPDVIHVDALAPGTRLGEFEILGLIGVGGFGMVYRAYDHSLQRDVAIKEYMPTALASRSADVLNISVRTSGDEETFRTGLESFVGEARMLAKFEHPSLVKVFRFWEANNTAYMVMPLYRGMTLKQARLRMRLPPSEAWLRKVLWSVLGALKVLHRGKALHRDVSPDNIFLQDVGPPVLLDLGAARLAISDRARQHTAVLKVNFAPIEQYADVKDMLQGPWTDLYSLSAVVHGLLCNEPPMPATIRVVNDSMPPFASVARTVAAEFGQRYSTEFVTGIAWGLCIRPQDRPQSVQEFAKALMLTTPNGMSSFDWRAELGPACLPAGDVLQLADAPEQPDRTRPDQARYEYQPTQLVRAAAATQNADDQDEESPTELGPSNADEPTPDHGARQTPQSAFARSMPEGGRSASDESAHASTEPMALASSDDQPHPPRPYATWLALSAVGMLVLIAAVWSWRGSTKPVLALPVPAVTAPATPSAAPASAPTATDAPATQQSSPKGATAGTPAPIDSASAAAAATTEKPAKPSRVATPRLGTTAAPGRVETPRADVLAAPAPAPVAPPPTPARPVPKPEPTMTAEKLCANENLFGKPMCMYRACQRPDLAGTAFCIEQEQRFKRAAESNNR